MRRTLVYVSMISAFLVWSVPAWAKDVGTARITGPGLGAPIELGRAETEQWWSETRLLDVKDPEPFTEDLGARYDVVLTIPLCDPEHPETVGQELYPYAAGGPEIFTPAGQGLCHVAPAGWSNGSFTLLAMLEEHGLPTPKGSAAPSRTAEAASAAVPSGPAGSSPVLVAGFVVGVTVVVAAGVLSGRERRRRTA